MIDFLGFSLLARSCPVKTMELVYLCTGQTAISVAVRKHTQEATARKVKFWFLEECLKKYFARVLVVSDSY